MPGGPTHIYFCAVEQLIRRLRDVSLARLNVSYVEYLFLFFLIELLSPNVGGQVSPAIVGSFNNSIFLGSFHNSRDNAHQYNNNLYVAILICGLIWYCACQGPSILDNSIS